MRVRDWRSDVCSADLFGSHDENVDFDYVVGQIGQDLAENIRAVTLRLYSEAAQFAADKGIIIADTKFEFGLDDQGQLHLMDEVLTPDSSRFWPASGYALGISPPSFDKQFVRDWLETQVWEIGGASCRERVCQ